MHVTNVIVVIPIVLRNLSQTSLVESVALAIAEVALICQAVRQRTFHKIARLLHHAQLFRLEVDDIASASLVKPAYLRFGDESLKRVIDEPLRSYKFYYACLLA